MSTSSTPSMNDISSSGLFLSSSTIFGPLTTTIHCPKSATLNTEPWNCNERKVNAGRQQTLFQERTRSYPSRSSAFGL